VRAERSPGRDETLDRAHRRGRARLADRVRERDRHRRAGLLVGGEALPACLGLAAERDRVGHGVAHLALRLRDVAGLHRRAAGLDLVREAALREHVAVEWQVRIAREQALRLVQARLPIVAEIAGREVADLVTREIASGLGRAATEPAERLLVARDWEQ